MADSDSKQGEKPSTWWDTTKTVVSDLVTDAAPIAADLKSGDNPFAVGPWGMMLGAAKLGYHAFTDPTQTMEQRAEHRMHMDDDLASMIPIYGTLMDIGELGHDGAAVYQRIAHGKSAEEAPSWEDLKRQKYLASQPEADAEEFRREHPEVQAAEDEASRREQHQADDNVEYTEDGVPYTPVAPVSPYPEYDIQ